MCPASFSNVISVLYSLSGFPILCLVAQLCSTLCDPMDCIARQAPLSMRILQARILEWIPYPFSRGTSRPRNRTGVSCIAGRFFTDWPIREAWISIYWVYMSIYIFLALKKEQHSKRNGRMIRGRQMILSDGIMTCWDHGLLKKQHTSFLRINRFYQLTEHRSNRTEKRKKRIYFPVGWILNGCFFT